MNNESFYHAVDLMKMSTTSLDYWLEHPNECKARIMNAYEIIESVRKLIEEIDK